MTPFEIYILVVSIIVLVSLSSFFAFLLGYIYLLTSRLIDMGYWDQEIIDKYAFKRRHELIEKISKVISTVMCVLLSGMLIFSIILGVTENNVTKSLSSLKVVKSESMSEKHQNNEYLDEFGLDDQMQVFDLIVTNPLPKEEEIKLYDIIVYERDGNLIIHRVVKIEEANDEHPEGRLFYTRGDANKYNDDLPVEYGQMKGIYRGERIPFIGSFVLFMQSPAGIICLLLIIFSMIIMPIVDKRLEYLRSERYHRLSLGFFGIRRCHRK